jgi:hypothetical protein
MPTSLKFDLSEPCRYLADAQLQLPRELHDRDAAFTRVKGTVNTCGLVGGWIGSYGFGQPIINEDLSRE